MPVVTSGLYSIVFEQSIQGNVLLNVFWYWEIGGANGEATRLATLFEDEVIPVMAPTQHVNLDYDLLTTKPIFGTGLEDIRVPTQSGGTLAGSSMNDAYAYSLRLLRSSNETRSGWKRFSGLIEESTAQRTFSASFITLMDAFGAVIDDRLAVLTFQFDPVIVRKPFSTKEQSADWVVNVIQGVQSLDRPTTQNSRKPF